MISGKFTKRDGREGTQTALVKANYSLYGEKSDDKEPGREKGENAKGIGLVE